MTFDGPKALVKWGCLITGIVIIAGCMRDPSLTNISDIRRSGEVLVGICYSAEVSTRQEVIDFAFKHCPEGSRNMTIYQHDTLLNDCPIVKKNRIVFQCRGGASEY